MSHVSCCVHTVTVLHSVYTVQQSITSFVFENIQVVAWHIVTTEFLLSVVVLEVVVEVVVSSAVVVYFMH